MTVVYGKEWDLGKSLFLKEEYSDVEILVETVNSTCRFPCHKIVLSTASYVFANIFDSKLNEGITGKVTVKDIDPDVMLCVLRYIYNGEVNLDNWKTATEVLQAAHKYQIASLVNSCEIYLSKNLTLRNVCFILDIAILYDLTELKKICLELCRSFMFTILKTKAFSEIRACAVKEMVSTANLLYDREIDLFKALWHWATMECCRKQKILTEDNISAEFSEFSKYIRMKRMTDAELASLPKSVMEQTCKNNIGNSPKNETVESVEIGKTLLSTRLFKGTVDITKKLTIHCECFYTTRNFTLDNSPNTSVEGNYLSLLRFSLNIDAYIEDFILMPFKDLVATSYIKSLQFYSMHEIVAQYPKQGENGTLYLIDLGTHYASLKRSTAVQKLRFVTDAYPLFKANVEYTLDIVPESCQHCPLHWPRVIPQDIVKASDDDVEVTFHSKYCYGITQIRFTQAF